MNLEFTNIEDAKAAVFDKQRKIVETFNQAAAKIDAEIVKQHALCNAAGTCLDRRRNASLQKDPRFIEWLSRHNQLSLGRLEWLYELRYKLGMKFNFLQEQAMQPVICAVHCGDTQDWTDCANEVIAQLKSKEIVLEDGVCIDIIIGDTDAVHRYKYTSDRAWNNVTYIEQADYRVETGDWTKPLVDML